MNLTPADRAIANGIAAAHPLTAHGITHASPVKVSGRHLSAALNDPSVNERDDDYPYAVEPSVYRDMAVEAQCLDMEALGQWLGNMEHVREPSAFGPISTQDLLAKFIFNDAATDAQLVIACHELKARYLTEYATDVAEAILRLQGDGL